MDIHSGSWISRSTDVLCIKKQIPVKNNKNYDEFLEATLVILALSLPGQKCFKVHFTLYCKSFFDHDVTEKSRSKLNI